jgi:uncharacterized membrane protein YhaH (DUF805 family)
MGAARRISTELGRVFDPSGRTGYYEFGTYALAVIGLAVACFVSVSVYFSDKGVGVAFVADLIVWVFASALLFSATVRRFHDIGRSAGWAMLFLLLPVLGLAPVLIALLSIHIAPPVGLGDDGRGIGSAFIAGYTVPLALIIGLVIFGRLCLKGSQPGPNRYGPPPLTEVTP